MPAPKRARTTTLLLLLTAALTAACGGGASTDEAPEAAGGANYPVTIPSALGDAVIDSQPERVVTLGQGSTETAIALDAVPVGVEEYAWGSDDTGYLPWVHEAVTAKGATLPTQFAGGTELDIDTILELDPDVILAPWSGITQAQFDLLNDIAPTVAYADQAWSTNWDEQITTIGKALGKPDEAAKLIGDIEGQLKTVADNHPKYKDTTFVYTYTSGPGTLGVFLPDEQRSAMLRKLGLTIDPVVETLPETEGTDSAVIGLENADKIAGADLMFTFYSDTKTRAEIEAQPLYASIPAVQRGSIVASDDAPFVTASSMINPLTVPWVIERYLPMIDGAIATLD